MNFGCCIITFLINLFNLQCPLDQDTFSQLNGFETLTNLLLHFGLNAQNTSPTLPNK